MLVYKYQARDNLGKVVNGQVEAADQQGAAAILANRNLMVVSLQAGGSRKAATKRLQGSVASQDLVVFTRQLATMVDAGLPLVQTLMALEEQTESKALKPILLSVLQKVESGDAFSTALACYPKVFNKLYVSMVEAGETGGLLAEILDDLAGEFAGTRIDDAHRQKLADAAGRLATALSRK